MAATLATPFLAPTVKGLLVERHRADSGRERGHGGSECEQRDALSAGPQWRKMMR